MATVFSAMGTVNSWKSIAANAKKKWRPEGTILIRYCVWLIRLPRCSRKVRQLSHQIAQTK